jgi:hypothetical protein
MLLDFGAPRRGIVCAEVGRSASQRRSKPYPPYQISPPAAAATQPLSARRNLGTQSEIAQHTIAAVSVSGRPITSVDWQRSSPRWPATRYSWAAGPLWLCAVATDRMRWLSGGGLTVRLCVKMMALLRCNLSLDVPQQLRHSRERSCLLIAWHPAGSANGACLYFLKH